MPPKRKAAPAKAGGKKAKTDNSKPALVKKTTIQRAASMAKKTLQNDAKTESKKPKNIKPDSNIPKSDNFKVSSLLVR